MQIPGIWSAVRPHADDGEAGTSPLYFEAYKCFTHYKRQNELTVCRNCKKQGHWRGSALPLAKCRKNEHCWRFCADVATASDNVSKPEIPFDSEKDFQTLAGATFVEKTSAKSHAIATGGESHAAQPSLLSSPVSCPATKAHMAANTGEMASRKSKQPARRGEKTAVGDGIRNSIAETYESRINNDGMAAGVNGSKASLRRNPSAKVEPGQRADETAPFVDAASSSDDGLSEPTKEQTTRETVSHSEASSSSSSKKKRRRKRV